MTTATTSRVRSGSVKEVKELFNPLFNKLNESKKEVDTDTSNNQKDSNGNGVSSETQPSSGGRTRRSSFSFWKQQEQSSKIQRHPTIVKDNEDKNTVEIQVPQNNPPLKDTGQSNPIPIPLPNNSSLNSDQQLDNNEDQNNKKSDESNVSTYTAKDQTKPNEVRQDTPLKTDLEARGKELGSRRVLSRNSNIKLQDLHSLPSIPIATNVTPSPQSVSPVTTPTSTGVPQFIPSPVPVIVPQQSSSPIPLSGPPQRPPMLAAGPKFYSSRGLSKSATYSLTPEDGNHSNDHNPLRHSASSPNLHLLMNKPISSEEEKKKLERKKKIEEFMKDRIRKKESRDQPKSQASVEAEAQRKKEEDERRKKEAAAAATAWKMKKAAEKKKKEQEEMLRREAAKKKEEEMKKKKEDNNNNNTKEVKKDIEVKKEELKLIASPRDDSSSDSEDGNPLERATQGIITNSIDVVDVKMEGLDDDTVSELLKHLLTNTSVKELLLDGNEMEVKSFLLLNELLTTNQHLTHISMNCVMCGELGAKTILKGLAANKTLECLSISGNDLFESGMEALGEGLKVNNHLHTLNLSENSISDAGCKALMAIMEFNKTLTTLDLSNNYINEEGATYLSTMVAQNSSLRRLNLQRNSLENVGCIAFAKALYTNSTLEELYMGNNIIETEGILPLAEALKANTGLKFLDLQHNIFDIESEVALQDVVISRNEQLTISWKKPPSKDDPPISRQDTQVIIDHFEPTKIIELFGKGKTLEPLIDIELLLTQINYTTQTSQLLWNVTSPFTGFGFHYRLDLLIRVITAQITNTENSNCKFEFTKLFITKMDHLCSLLKPKPGEKLLFPKFQVFQLCTLLCTIEDPALLQVLLISELFDIFVDMFFIYTNMSIFLSHFVGFVEQLLNNTCHNNALLEKLFINANFLKRIIALYQKECVKPVPMRVGNFGHMTKISNKLREAATHNETLKNQLEGIPEWTNFVTSSLDKINQINTVPEIYRPTDTKKKPGEIADFDDSLM